MEQSSTPQKILYIITKSNFGGAQRYIYDLVTNIPPDQFKPVVACGGTGLKGAPVGALQQKLTEKGFRCITLSYFMRDMSFLNDIQAFFEVFNCIRKERPDVLHVTSSKAGGIGVFAGRMLRIPTIIFTSHGLAYDEIWRPYWQRVLIKTITWMTIFLSTKTIQITNDTYMRASKLPLCSNKNVLIHNGINIPPYGTREKARSILSKEKRTDELWIGTIAELTKNKNLDVLIEGFARFHEQKPTTHLWILGEGEERKHLEHIVQQHNLASHVHLPGYVNNASHMLKAFDVFMLPSQKEGLPYVLLEAGLASLPVIASNIPGIVDIITDQETGIIITPTPQTITDTLTTLTHDTIRSKIYAEKLHAHVLQHFSISLMIEQTTSLYAVSNPSISLSSFPRCTERS